MNNAVGDFTREMQGRVQRDGVPRVLVSIPKDGMLIMPVSDWTQETGTIRRVCYPDGFQYAPKGKRK